MSGGIRLVSISGNLATGKSTLFRSLLERFHFTALPENAAGNTFLTEFGRTPSRWAFQNFIWFLNDRVRQQEIARDQKTQNWLQERSVAEDLAVFLPSYHDAGFLSDAETQLVRGVGEIFQRQALEPIAYICLEAQTDTVVQRIKERMRFSEGTLDTRYFELLGERYANWHRQLQEPAVIIDTSTLDIGGMCDTAAKFLTKLEFY